MECDFLYLAKRDITELGVGMAEIISVVEHALLQKALGQVEMPPKPGIHTRPDSFVHAMPAYIRTPEAAGMKWIAGYPANQDRGLPYISGLLILNDPETGFPLAVMDATWITAMRTAAATAVAAKYLCRKDARSLAILGCGVQGRSNTEALRTVLDKLDTVWAYDSRRQAAQLFAEEVEARRGIRCVVCKSAEEAVRAADVVVTAGPILKHPQPTIVPEWLAPGAFVCSLDFDSYVTAAVFHSASIFATDDVVQLRYYQSAGYFADVPNNSLDLGDIVAGKHPGRQTSSETTVSVNLGLGLEDIVTAKLIFDRAVVANAGVRLPL